MPPKDDASAGHDRPALQLIDAEATRAALSFERLIPCLRDAFAAGCTVPLRSQHAIENNEEPTATLLLMPAWTRGGFLGIKIVSVFPGNSARGEPAVTSLYLLSNAVTGKQLALIDGNELTARRTAAASALAASYLAREDARSLLIVGAGHIAHLLAPAYRAVRPIESVQVWNVRRENAEKLVKTLRGLGFDASPVDRIEAAVAEVDIVSCATLAQNPLVRGEWLKPGTHLDLIGGFTPEMRETDDVALQRASVFIDTPAALVEAGDLTQAIAAGTFTATRVRGNLEALCRGRIAGRSSRDEITLFKSVGSALEDLAAAVLVFRVENLN
jgi:ornithine cyclodeaminase/alanine dehydrogenase-like protein (mu-crystallin family)